jgi:hypothetical protein
MCIMEKKRKIRMLRFYSIDTVFLQYTDLDTQIAGFFRMRISYKFIIVYGVNRAMDYCVQAIDLLNKSHELVSYICWQVRCKILVNAFSTVAIRLYNNSWIKLLHILSCLGICNTMITLLPPVRTCVAVHFVQYRRGDMIYISIGVD